MVDRLVVSLSAPGQQTTTSSRGTSGTADDSPLRSRLSTSSLQHGRTPAWRRRRRHVTSLSLPVPARGRQLWPERESSPRAVRQGPASHRIASHRIIIIIIPRGHRPTSARAGSVAWGPSIRRASQSLFPRFLLHPTQRYYYVPPVTFISIRTTSPMNSHGTLTAGVSSFAGNRNPLPRFQLWPTDGLPHSRNRPLCSPVRR